MEDNFISLKFQFPYGKATPPLLDFDGDGAADYNESISVKRGSNGA
ncbi:MAG: hypothetical protein OSA92_03300 [Pirellulaceae bacterium]|nr:hypothetical protein [Pirellulaceae bacterium]